MCHIKWSGEKISDYLFSKTHTPKTSELITDDLPCPLTKMSCGGGCLSITHVITLRRKLHIRVKQPLRGKRLVSALRMRVGIFYFLFKAVVLKWHRIWLWAIETSVLWNLLDHIISSLHCKSRLPLTSIPHIMWVPLKYPQIFMPYAPSLFNTWDFFSAPGIPMASGVPPDWILHARDPRQLPFILRTISASTARKLHPSPTPAPAIYLTGKRASPLLSAHISVSSTASIP